MSRVSKQFNMLINALNCNPHEPSHAPLEFDYIVAALKWKYDSVFVHTKRIFAECLPGLLIPNKKVESEMIHLEKDGLDGVWHEELDSSRYNHATERSFSDIRDYPGSLNNL